MTRLMGLIENRMKVIEELARDQAKQEGKEITDKQLGKIKEMAIELSPSMGLEEYTERIKRISSNVLNRKKIKITRAVKKEK